MRTLEEYREEDKKRQPEIEEALRKGAEEDAESQRRLEEMETTLRSLSAPGAGAVGGGAKPDESREPEEEETAPKTPAEEINGFISEFKLESMLPPEFKNLTEAQRLKVIRDLKKRIVDIVKSDGQTQYSEDAKAIMTKLLKPSNNIIFKAWATAIGTIGNAITKEIDLKKAEGKVFANLIDSEEGKGLIAADLARLTVMIKDKNVVIDHGKPCITYLTYHDFPGITPEEKKVVENFTKKTDAFTAMPYEWGQEKSGGNKKKYEKAKAEYEAARNEVLKIKEVRETPENRGGAMLEMLEIDNALQMEQLLNTHPEFEKALSEFGESAGGKEMVKTAGNFLQTITGGKNWTNKLLTVGGFGARMAAKGAAVLTGATMCTALGAPIIGGTIGYLRGRVRAKGTLEERQKSARHGKGDESKEATNVEDAENLNKRLEERIQAYQDAKAAGGYARGGSVLKILDQIKRRIEYTQDKIENGLVNFGEAKSALANQFNLINNLNQALVISASLEKTTRKDIDARLERFLEYQAGKIDEAQNAFIRKQALKGAAIGAGFATLGYGVRWFGEHMGWWGHHLPADFQEVKTPDGATGWVQTSPDGTAREILSTGKVLVLDKEHHVTGERMLAREEITYLNKKGLHIQVPHAPSAEDVHLQQQNLETQKFIVEADRQLNTDKNYQDFVTDERIKIRAMEADDLLKVQHGQMTQEEFDISKQLHEIEINEKIILKRKELILEKIKEALTPKKGAKMEPWHEGPPKAHSPFALQAEEQKPAGGAETAKNALAQTDKDLADQEAKKAELLRKLSELKAHKQPTAPVQTSAPKAETPPATPAAAPAAAEAPATAPAAAPAAPAENPPVKAPVVETQPPLENKPLTQYNPPAPAPEQGLPSLKINSDAVVHQGQGVEHAFIRQIEHNPKLAQELGFKGDVNDKAALHAFAGKEAHIVATQAGYVDNAGHEVYVMKADKVGYELSADSEGHPIVVEKTVEGETLGTYDNEGGYEFGKNPDNPFEKEVNVGTGHHGAIHPSAEKTAGAPAEEENYTPMRGGYSPLEKGYSPIEDNPEPVYRDTIPESSSVAEPIFNPSGPRDKFGRLIGHNGDGARVEQIKRSILDRFGQEKAPLTKEQIDIVTGSGINRIDAHELTAHEISERAGTILRNNPEFVKNPFHLPPERLVRAYDVGQEKITAVIRHNNFGANGWRAMKDLKVNNLVGNKDYHSNNPMIQYLNRLRDVTKEKPQGANIFHRAETVKEYIARALQKAAKMEKLGDIENWEPK